MNSINLYIKGYSYEFNDENDFVLDILIGDLEYKEKNKEKDIAFVTFTNEVLFPEHIVILINYGKYNKFIEENKKELLKEIQKYANSIDNRISAYK